MQLFVIKARYTKLRAQSIKNLSLRIVPSVICNIVGLLVTTVAIMLQIKRAVFVLLSFGDSSASSLRSVSLQGSESSAGYNLILYVSLLGDFSEHSFLIVLAICLTSMLSLSSVNFKRSRALLWMIIN